MRRLAVAFVATLLVVGTGAAVAAQAPGGTNRSAVTHQNGGVREHGNANHSEMSEDEDCIHEQDEDDNNQHDQNNQNQNNQSETPGHHECVDEQHDDNNHHSHVSGQDRGAGHQGAQHEGKAHRSERSDQQHS